MEVFWSSKLKVPNADQVQQFLQHLANRIMQGHCRYGSPNKAKRYMRRLELELKEYKITGNNEHLLNVAVYCWLESMAPENKRFHFDASVDSATRGKQ
jgi:hypothetical protein